MRLAPCPWTLHDSLILKDWKVTPAGRDSETWFCWMSWKYASSKKIGQSSVYASPMTAGLTVSNRR
jgi:hypothetical protein